ncbi:MAG: hypothetical protein IT493_08900 [Gammaproteobacteria bacterium]|nr:hypothetical protein [Gammaproteobacteria bacterium]
MRPGAIAPLFSSAFALGYGWAAAAHLQWFIYYPAVGEWTMTTQPAADAGPPMLWYGWLACGAIGGVLAALVGLVLPRAFEARVWPLLSWSVPIGATLWLAWQARVWFQQ